MIRHAWRRWMRPITATPALRPRRPPPPSPQQQQQRQQRHCALPRARLSSSTTLPSEPDLATGLSQLDQAVGQAGDGVKEEGGTGGASSAPPQDEAAVAAFTSRLDECADFCDAELAVRLIEEMKRSGLRPTVDAYNAVIRAHTARGKRNSYRGLIAEAERVFRRMWHEELVEPNAASFAALIDGNARLGYYGRAHKWLLRMRRAQVEPSAEAYDALVEARARQARESGGLGHVAEAERLLAAELKAGLAPGPAALGALVDACVQLGEVDRAADMFDKVKRASGAPGLGGSGHSEASCVLASALAEQAKSAQDPKRLERAERLLEAELKEGGGSQAPSAAAAFNSVVEACARLGAADRAAAWFGEMQRAEVGPVGQQTYAALVQAGAEEGKAAGDEERVDAAGQVLEAMLRDGSAGVGPDPAVFIALIDAYARIGLVDRATLWLSRMKKAGLRPDVRVYNVFIGACAESGKRLKDPSRIGKAEQIIQAMPKNGVEPCAASFHPVIDAYAELDDVESAVRWFDEMKKAGVRPDAKTYRTLISSHAHQGRYRYDREQFVAAERILEEMSEEGFEPDLASLDILVRRWAQFGELDRAIWWFRSMLSKDMEPSLNAFTTLLNACAKRSKAGTWDHAKEVSKEMKRASIKPNAVTFACMLKVCSRAAVAERRAERRDVLSVAEEVIDEMKKTVRPNHVHLTECLYLQKRYPTEEKPKEWIKWIIDKDRQSPKKKRINTKNLPRPLRAVLSEVLQEVEKCRSH